MTDIEDRLRAHLLVRAAEVAPLDTLAQIVTDTTVVSYRPKSLRRRWWPVAAAAAVVLVIGGVAVLGRSNSPTKPAFVPPPPLPAGVPLTGVEWTLAGQMKLEAAVRVIEHECMQRAGVQFDLGLDDLFVAMGAWMPDPVLGVLTEAGAAKYGYHSASDGGWAPDQVPKDPAEQARYYTALVGQPDAPTVDVLFPDGTPSGTAQSRGGCMAEVESAFDGLLTQQEGLRVYVNERATDSVKLADQTEKDPRVVAVLGAWRDCVSRVAGEAALGSAQTPNELARKFALSDSSATSAEKALAVTDARCQAEVGLQTTYSQVHAEYQRAALTEHKDWFDQLATMRAQIVATAGEILKERGLDTTVQ